MLVDPQRDAFHARVMKLRLDSLKSPPAAIAQSAMDLSKLESDRERSNRVVLEFFSKWATDPATSKSELHVGLRIIPSLDKPESQVHSGINCLARGPDVVVSHVVLDASTSSASGALTKRGKVVNPTMPPGTLTDRNAESKPTKVKGLTLNEPNEGKSYLLRKPGTSRIMCSITVHWAAELHMAPLQIRYAPPVEAKPSEDKANESADEKESSGEVAQADDHRKEHRRRIVVQLAPMQTSAKGSAAVTKPPPDEVEGGYPLVYEAPSGETLQSGWVSYVVGTKGGRGQGLINTAWGNRAKAAGGLESELASRWIDRLQEATEEMVSDAVGQIRDVQAALVYGASQHLSIDQIPSNPQANPPAKDRGGDGAGNTFDLRLMLRSVCEGFEPVIHGLYEEMCTIVREQGQDNSRLLTQMFPDKEGNNDENRPKSFYQVALDLPGYGQSDGAPLDAHVSVKLLTEVIRSLAKVHAFCIVAYAQGAAAMLSALLAEPKLTSFLIVREPDLERLDMESLHGVLHPTLAPYDPDGPQTLVRATRSLNAVLPQLTFCKFSLTKNPQFYQRELATEMMAYFRANNWHGALPTLGNSSMLALLTRLAGGMGAWRGDAKLMAKRAEKARAKAKAAEEKAAAKEAAVKARKEQKEQAKIKSEAVKSKMRGLLGAAKKDSDGAEESGAGGGKRRASASGGERHASAGGGGGSLLDRLKAAKLMSAKADDGGGEGAKAEVPEEGGVKEVVVDHWLQAMAQGEKAAESGSQGGLLGLLMAAKPPQTSDAAVGHEHDAT